MLADQHPFPAKAPTPHPRLIPFRVGGIGTSYNRRRTRKSQTSGRGVWPMHSPWSASSVCRLSMECEHRSEGYQSPDLLYLNLDGHDWLVKTRWSCILQE